MTDEEVAKLPVYKAGEVPRGLPPGYHYVEEDLSGLRWYMITGGSCGVCNLGSNDTESEAMESDYTTSPLNVPGSDGRPTYAVRLQQRLVLVGAADRLAESRGEAAEMDNAALMYKDLMLSFVPAQDLYYRFTENDIREVESVEFDQKSGLLKVEFEPLLYDRCEDAEAECTTHAANGWLRDDRHVLTPAEDVDGRDGDSGEGRPEGAEQADPRETLELVLGALTQRLQQLQQQRQQQWQQQPGQGVPFLAALKALHALGAKHAERPVETGMDRLLRALGR